MIGDKIKYKCIFQYNYSKARFEAKEIRKDMKYIHVFEILNTLCVLKIIGNVYQNKGLLN